MSPKPAACSPAFSFSGVDPQPGLRVAYLVNQYPSPSHAFIRREILALEAQGVTVDRFSMRRPPESLKDPADRAEAGKTTVILSVGLFGLLVAALRVAVTGPLRFLRAFGLAVRCGRRSERGVAYHVAYLAEACVLLGWLRMRGVQHVHAHFGTNPTAVAMLMRVLAGSPYSFTVHGPYEFDRATVLALTEKIDHAAFVAAISEFGRSQLYRRCPHSQWDRIRVVHCGVDETFLNDEAVAVPAAPRFVCVGRICEQKGHLLLVDAVARLAAQGVQLELILVGDGPLRAEVQASIAMHGLEGLVSITGWASSLEIRDYILSSRALVLPSFAEGLPVVIMESLALGRPVISTTVAGIPELVEPGVSGWLVAPGSIDALVAAMREALESDPIKLAEMGARGKEVVRARHDARVEAAKIRQLILESLEGGVVGELGTVEVVREGQALPH